VQARPPSREGKVQIFYAANALIAQLGEQRLTMQQYRDAWARLFSGSGTTPASGSAPLVPRDVHLDPSRPPSVNSLGTGIASVLPLSSASIPGYPYANRNTDACMKFRIAVGTSNVGAGSLIATIRFGSEFRARDPRGVLVPFQPNVLVQSADFGIAAIESSSFTLQNLVELPAGGSMDVFLTAVAGQPTE
jgi:hypothetical protein